MSRARTREPMLVRDAGQLQNLARPGRPITLEGWPEPVRAAHEERLTKWATECGCETGAAGMIVLGLLAVLIAVRDVLTAGPGAIGPGHAAAVLGGLVAGAVIGKAIGLAWAGLQWRRAVDAAVGGMVGARA